jgi:serine/threonine protein kinase
MGFPRSRGCLALAFVSSMTSFDDSHGSSSQLDDIQILAGRYRLDRRIGQGGMAEVWVAVDEQLDRRVAVKWLKPNLATDEVVAERFRREAIAVARLNHPNIVSVHDVFEHDGRQAVVMQLVEGRSLRQVLDSQKRLGPELTIHIGASVAAGLDAAHAAGFVHRDVKPGNILVTEDGRVLLTDFGIAKGLDGGEDDLTSDNVMMGTAKYLSPEQVRGHKLDGRADLYSLALVLYECLAGRVPFLGQSDADTALARLQRDPTDLAHLRPTLPISLVNLIHRTLARNPAHRPATGGELRQELMNVDTTPPQIDGTPIEPPTPRTQPVRPGESGRLPRVTTTITHPIPEVAPATTTQLFNDPSLATPRVVRRPWIPIALATAVVVFLIAALVVTNRDAETSSNVSPLPDATPASVVERNSEDPIILDDVEDSLSPETRVPVSSTSLEVTAWDPFGDNGSENDAQAPLAIADGSRDTAWSTECYNDQYLGAKPGVGLVVTLPELSSGRLEFETLNAPFQIEVYRTDAVEPPLSLDSWVQVGSMSYGVEPGAVAVSVGEASTHLAIWLKELGPDDACSSANPYRGRIGELQWLTNS